jgi:hypothetical protein
MGMVDISRVTVRQLDSGMEGLFSTCAVEPGEMIFLETYPVYESAAAQNSYIPQVVRLASRLHTENHFEQLVRLGMRPECWTLGVEPEHAHWLKKLVETGSISADRMHDTYCLAAAYNISLVTALPTGIDEITIFERVVIAPFVCKANHSCEPNASVWSPRTKEGVRERIVGMVAIHHISEGEEITYAYPSDRVRDLPNELKTKIENTDSFLALGSSNRKSILRQLHGFECICSRCARFE